MAATVFTYFDDDGMPSVSTEVPHAGVGKVWVRGSYQPPVYPSPLDVRIAGGNKVWLIIDMLDGRTPAEVAEVYAPYMTEADVEAAIRFYRRNRDAIDGKIAEHRAVA